MGHVLARLSGFGMVVVPRWPYMFERVPGDPVAVRASHWTPDGQQKVAVIRQGQPFGTGDVVDVAGGPDQDYWLIETSMFRVGWPADFTVEPAQDLADPTPFYVHGPGNATIFPQGPIAKERLADPNAVVAPDQTILERRSDDGNAVVEVTYSHDGKPWWQGHWMITFDKDEMLVITAQSPRPDAARSRAAARAMASSVC